MGKMLWSVGQLLVFLHGCQYVVGEDSGQLLDMSCVTGIHHSTLSDITTSSNDMPLGVDGDVRMYPDSNSATTTDFTNLSASINLPHCLKAAIRPAGDRGLSDVQGVDASERARVSLDDEKTSLLGALMSCIVAVQLSLPLVVGLVLGLTSCRLDTAGEDSELSWEDFHIPRALRRSRGR